MPETRGREIYDIVKQLMRETEKLDELPKDLTKKPKKLPLIKFEAIEKSLKILSKSSKKSIPKILIKSASNRTIKELSPTFPSQSFNEIELNS